MENLNTSPAPRFEIVELTLGEALQRANRIKGELSERATRASGNVMYVLQEKVDGDAPKQAFTFGEDWAAVTTLQENLIRLKAAVALSNARLKVEFEGMKIPLVEAVIRQQELKGEIVRLKNLPIHERDERRPRTSWDGTQRVEVETVTKHRSHLPDRDRANQAAALQKRLDALIAAVNRINGKSTVKVELLLVE